MIHGIEVNFDGMVGPTHNYAGLSLGNLASQQHQGRTSHPKAAALQGLAKMKFLADLGVMQAVLPPHPRPDLAMLRRLGFGGTVAEVLQQAARQAPQLLAACYSASGMWAANAATVSPSADAADSRLHITPANLLTQFHRWLETGQTARILGTIFSDPSLFAQHPPLPAADAFGDEGAANHMRLCPEHGLSGIEVFVYGRDADGPSPARFPARQTREACQAIGRTHLLEPSRTIFLQQNPAAIDAGVFHNDVIAVANENVLLCHASAFADPAAKDQLRRAFADISEKPLHIIEASDAELSLADAERSYLFNSQLVTLAYGGMALIAPMECRENPRAQAFIARVLAGENPIHNVYYVDVRQSMDNGGGPACLRLRVVLTPQQLAALPAGILLTGDLYARLVQCVQRHYRDDLGPGDLADPDLARQCQAAIEDLRKILGIG